MSSKSPISLPADRPLEGLGRALEKLRQTRGLSRSELARKAGVGLETVSRCEKEGAYPSTRVLESLLAALDAHLGDLFGAQIAAWHEPLLGWPEQEAAEEATANVKPGQIPWLELRARVGRLHQQLERLEAAVYGESVAQTSRLVQSLTEDLAGREKGGTPGLELDPELVRELKKATHRLHELHNLLQVEPSARLDLQADYADNGDGVPSRPAPGKPSTAGKPSKAERKGR